MSELVERLTSEGLIGMRAAAQILGARHACTPTRHALKGVRTPGGTLVKLEAIRCGGKLLTSRSAVLRFLAAQNTPVVSCGNLPQEAPPAQSRRRASKASAAVESLLGANA